MLSQAEPINQTVALGTLRDRSPGIDLKQDKLSVLLVQTDRHGTRFQATRSLL